MRLNLCANNSPNWIKSFLLTWPTLQALSVPFLINPSASSIHLITDSISVSNVFHFLLTSSRCLWREVASSTILSTCWSTFQMKFLTSIVRASGRILINASPVSWSRRRYFLHFFRNVLSRKNSCRENFIPLNHINRP